MNQKHGCPPPYMKRGLEFDSALKIFLNHLVISFQHKINFIDKTGLNKLSFQSQVKFIPTNVPITMQYQLLKILCIAIHYQDLESVKSLVRPMKEYDTCVRTLIKAKHICHNLGFRHAKIVQKIAQACKNPNKPNNFGNTALHLAAQRGQIEVVKVLLPFCKSMNAKNHKQKTAMQVAYENGHYNIVKLLLQNVSFKTCTLL